MFLVWYQVFKNISALVSSIEYMLFDVLILYMVRKCLILMFWLIIYGHRKLTLPLFTFSAQRGPYWGIPSAISSHASTVGARHLSMGIEAASRSSLNFSAYPSSVSGDQLRYGSTASAQVYYIIRTYRNEFSHNHGLTFRVLLHVKKKLAYLPTCQTYTKLVS